jgi:predicted transcriptional regulator of viral defense system
LALHFHGFTEQAPRQVFVAVTRAKRPLIWRGLVFRFVACSRRLLRLSPRDIEYARRLENANPEALLGYLLESLNQPTPTSSPRQSRFRVPAIVLRAEKLAGFADLPGLTVCRRAGLTPSTTPASSDVNLT